MLGENFDVIHANSSRKSLDYLFKLQGVNLVPGRNVDRPGKQSTPSKRVRGSAAWILLPSPTKKSKIGNNILEFELWTSAVFSCFVSCFLGNLGVGVLLLLKGTVVLLFAVEYKTVLYAIVIWIELNLRITKKVCWVFYKPTATRIFKGFLALVERSFKRFEESFRGRPHIQKQYRFIVFPTRFKNLLNQPPKQRSRRKEIDSSSQSGKIASHHDRLFGSVGDFAHVWRQKTSPSWSRRFSIRTDVMLVIVPFLALCPRFSSTICKRSACKIHSTLMARTGHLPVVPVTPESSITSGFRQSVVALHAAGRVERNRAGIPGSVRPWTRLLFFFFFFFFPVATLP